MSVWPTSYTEANNRVIWHISATALKDQVKYDQKPILTAFKPTKTASPLG